MSSILNAMQRQSNSTQGYDLNLLVTPRWPIWLLGIGGFVAAMVLGAFIFWNLNDYRISLQGSLSPSIPVVTEPLLKPVDIKDSNSQLDAFESRARRPMLVSLSESQTTYFADIPRLKAKEVDLLELHRELLREQALRPSIVATKEPEFRMEEPKVVSGSLESRFAKAVSATQDKEWGYQNDYDGVPWLSQLEADLTSELPELTFTAHVYSSDPTRRYVRINDLELKEGDFIEQMEVVAIRLDDIVLRIGGRLGRLAALTDWAPIHLE